jgi:predicted P-loop ATPase
VLKPGCKFDTCLVLEGPQGRKKSTALRVLAGEWFSDTELDLAHKDSMSYIRGKWLHEFGELGSLARTEEMRQKSFLSRQVDEFRPSYGRREIRCARQVAFAGTTNQWQWNKDPTGGRRFWPVEVGEDLRTEALQEAREQLFAEAFAAALAGERYWPDAAEQAELFDPEQASRETPEVFVEILGAWLDSSEGMLLPEFSIADACLKGLKLDAKALQRDVQTRVGIALKKLGCERVERRNSVVRFVYKRPERKTASSPAPTEAHDVEVPF